MPAGPPAYTKEQIERMARMYATNTDAEVAMGIGKGSFKRICARLGVESPSDRRAREEAEMQMRREHR